MITRNVKNGGAACLMSQPIAFAGGKAARQWLRAFANCGPFHNPTARIADAALIPAGLVAAWP